MSEVGAEDALDKGPGGTPAPRPASGGDMAQWRRGATSRGAGASPASPRSDASPAPDGSRGGAPAGGGGGGQWDSPRCGPLSGARGDEPGLPGTPKRGPPARPPPPLPTDLTLASPAAADAADGVSGGEGGDRGSGALGGAEGSAAGGDGVVLGAEILRGVYAALHGGYDEARKWRGQEDVAIILPAKTQRVRLRKSIGPVPPLELVTHFPSPVPSK